jgi:predicted type IV restriction endonuclease
MIAGVTNGVEWVVITDLKIWLFARSEEGKKIRIRKLGKPFHITKCTTFLQFLNVNIYKN